MVFSTSQQVALAFTVVLFSFVVLPRLLGVGSAAKDGRTEPRHGRKGPGPGAARGQPHAAQAFPSSSSSSPQSPENLKQMKKLMEEELKSDKYKSSSSSSKGYVFTLMPLYAIGVGVFAAYKFLKIKSADDQAQKNKFAMGAKKSAEAENQLNELEQRLAQTERMLNSILTQLDPLTNCVKSVAQEQKSEIMSQLHTIRYLMKKRGMDCPPLRVKDSPCERSLDDLIESLSAREVSAPDPPAACTEAGKAATQASGDPADEAVNEEAAETGEEVERKAEEKKPEEEEEEEDDDKEEENGEEDGREGADDEDVVPQEGATQNTNAAEVKAEGVTSGLRRRNRPE